MKLLVCDVEGTIFVPHMIKSSQHASYIWTAIAQRLGKDAEREEINTQKKWRDGGYGSIEKGQAYIDWVNETISIHKKYKLTEIVFNDIIDNAPYVEGVKEFFKNLNRAEYIPILISGGIQNLSEKACRDLGVDEDNSYSSCKYYFDSRGEINESLTFLNTSNFFGKQELVKIALRKYGLSEKDWIFLGDGINDVSVAKYSPQSIGINPVPELKDVALYSYSNYFQMMQDKSLVESQQLLSEVDNENNIGIELVEMDENQLLQSYFSKSKQNAYQRTNKQVGNISLSQLESRAWKRMQRVVGFNANKHKSKFFGITQLLEAGELSFLLFSEISSETEIPSAVLQPFCNATESMIYICLALMEEKEALEKLLKIDSGYSLACLINGLGNANLSSVLKEYFQNRNIAAHTYQLIPIAAAKSFIQRTYESIQRLELIINPIEFIC
jgi:phosphoserine phosphatase